MFLDALFLALSIFSHYPSDNSDINISDHADSINLFLQDDIPVEFPAEADNDLSSKLPDVNIPFPSLNAIQDAIENSRGKDFVERRRPWELKASYKIQEFSTDLDNWRIKKVTIRRKHNRGSIGVEGQNAQRFGKGANGAALDIWNRLWHKAYGNLKLGTKLSGTILPKKDYYAEVFQGLGNGWEGSGFYRRMYFTSKVVNLYGFSIGKYIGSWYLRERTTIVPKDEGTGLSHAFYARYYFMGNPNDFIEVGAGFGKSFILIGKGPRIDKRHKKFYSITIEKYLSDTVGVFASFNYNDEDVRLRRGYTLGFMYRW